MEHAFTPLDFKQFSQGKVQGLAASYDNVDSHGETFAPGAFTETLTSGRQVAMLLHHDPKRPVGRWDSLREHSKGLDVAGSLALDVPDGQEAYALTKAGALTGLSVGFVRKEGRGSVITKAELYEISLVAVPSNPVTYVSGVKAFGSARELEDHLREIGLSGRRAKAAASAAFRAADAAQDEQVLAKAAERLSASTLAISKLMGV